jgi:septum formation protein
MRLVLASKSRDRKKCFDLARIPIEVIPSDFDEESVPIQEPLKLVEILALEKAKVVVNLWNQTRAHQDGSALVIAGDTMVAHKGKLIGKAKDKQHAFDIIKTLINQTHYLITGVAIIQTDTKKQKSFVDSSKVHFQNLSDEEIWEYLNRTNEYEGRAGAYSLQERASMFIDHIEGSPTNVLGIPMAKLREEMKDFGISLLSTNGQ